MTSLGLFFVAESVYVRALVAPKIWMHLKFGENEKRILRHKVRYSGRIITRHAPHRAPGCTAFGKQFFLHDCAPIVARFDDYLNSIGIDNAGSCRWFLGSIAIR